MREGLLGLGAFVLGGIPFGLLLARARGIDLRTVGSGNIGASNAARALGRRWGVVVLLLDAAKGFGPTWLAAQLNVDPWMVAGTGLIAVLGHTFSIFLRGRGGKGVATALGVTLALAPLAAALAFAVFALLFIPLRISSVGSMSAAVTFPLAAWALGQGTPAVAFGAVAAVLIIARHHENIARLVRGTELRS